MQKHYFSCSRLSLWVVSAAVIAAVGTFPAASPWPIFNESSTRDDVTIFFNQLKIKMASHLPAPSLPSERSFGVLFAIVFSGFAAYAAYKSWPQVSVIALVFVGLVFGFAAFFAPKILAPLNRLWFALGIVLGRIVSPIVLGVIFFGIITPVGVITRLFGRDELLVRKRAVPTYWVERSPAGPEPESFKNQY